MKAECTIGKEEDIIWAPSNEFVSSSIPSWQSLTAHAQPFRGARDLAFCLKVPLDSLLVWASSGGSGETARMRRLAWTFAARIGDKYQIRLTRSIYYRAILHPFSESYCFHWKLSSLFHILAAFFFYFKMIYYFYHAPPPKTPDYLDDSSIQNNWSKCHNRNTYFYIITVRE